MTPQKIIFTTSFLIFFSMNANDFVFDVYSPYSSFYISQVSKPCTIGDKQPLPSLIITPWGRTRVDAVRLSWSCRLRDPRAMDFFIIQTHIAMQKLHKLVLPLLLVRCWIEIMYRANTWISDHMKRNKHSSLQMTVRYLCIKIYLK